MQKVRGLLRSWKSDLRNISFEQHTLIGGEVTNRSYRLRYPELQGGNRSPVIEDAAWRFRGKPQNPQNNRHLGRAMEALDFRQLNARFQ